MEVHRHLGPGFLEAVYQQALALEMELRNIPFVKEASLPVHYKGQQLSCNYRADFVCFDSVILELKAIAQLDSVHTAQVINYLKATGFKRGLLMNFSAKSLQHIRLVNQF
jgi:GxxExxY protein